jgi:hypothetical protein
MSKPLSLSDQQMQRVTAAAALLAPSARDNFLRSIANRLCELASPTDADVAAAVNFVLSTRGISTPAYLCDGATLTNRRQSRRKIFFATVSRSIPKQEEQSMRHKTFRRRQL